MVLTLASHDGGVCTEYQHGVETLFVNPVIHPVDNYFLFFFVCEAFVGIYPKKVNQQRQQPYSTAHPNNLTISVKLHTLYSLKPQPQNKVIILSLTQVFDCFVSETIVDFDLGRHYYFSLPWFDFAACFIVIVAH